MLFKCSGSTVFGSFLEKILAEPLFFLRNQVSLELPDKELILKARIHGAWHNIRNFQRNPVRSWSWESQMQCQRPIQGLHSLHLECKTMSLTLQLGLFVIHVLSPSWLFVLEVLWLVQFAFYDCKWDRGLLHAHSCVDIRVSLRLVYLFVVPICCGVCTFVFLVSLMVWLCRFGYS